MNILRKVELGVIVVLILAVINFAFWLGRLSQRLENLEQRVSRLEATQKAPSAPSPTPTAPGSSSPSVTLTLASNVDPSHAPFRIGVNGTVAGATRLYTYIIVDDGNAEWIQPGLGYNRDGPFFSSAYLGLENEDASLKKWYTVFAVVSSTEHKKYQHLNPASVRVRTKPIRVYRTH